MGCITTKLIFRMAPKHPNATERILVTGGAGYIGSHTAVVLIEAGYDLVILDNLANANIEAIKRIEELTNHKVAFEDVDLTNATAVDAVFGKYNFTGVIHFAALKAVGESSKIPLMYYHVNVGGTINLLMSMQKHKVNNLVFSSSATVYGDVQRLPNPPEKFPETLPLEAVNPYGRTKVCIEQILGDHSAAYKPFNACMLRYFNPVGAHPSGKIGENPLGIPNNLLPYIGQVATAKRECLSIFGNDYDSVDGTPIRDYIHIMDLAEAHVAALKYIEKHHVGCKPWNIGTGSGKTVFEVVRAFENSTGVTVPYKVVDRRAGDVLRLVADPTLANKDLGWQAKRTIEEGCKHMWNWVKKNPNGYEKE